MKASLGNARRRAFTLVELLITVVLMSIVAGMVVARFEPEVAEQLNGVARVLVADLDYARGMAVSYNSTYKIVVDVNNNRYYLQHTGANTALDTLPKAPFLEDGVDGANKPLQQTRLSTLLNFGPTVELHAAKLSPSGTAVSDVEFNPLGGTTAASNTVIWLRCGNGGARRYLPVTINAITGVTSVGDLQSTAP